ncbi:tRNA lysidine(34) synthetase TilS [Helicobacter saguini]|uniref:tRNA(Ile)-lysidine synthase n=1 Tax=Helicobacter saguini TaxID=1548018 RepID=A0A347VRP1_9HELI|nr:tRNA lysidine(34) synthetase TilS [Helicobacter saguini]MWV62831.1 tRNA lysidine(34) synthetase TilS [Helicobacter saguini]MWV66500.1 tRNA lysidine(34) synthetase TilS [Helicobacter saguini]MWV68849.1 tRNA lysidine(34) synthetase TilS [Helicobacter saguini]MWV71596.1 tRNA lysidine(34) synthetase TilS [Helicobacter saguini]TLD94402.1 tRNA lysidine(34) synthetase TilS [Helicobacter saguini]
MLEIEVLKILKDSKNLLAFSHGCDSSALFFILLNLNIDFDIAIVNYNVRKQSKDEVRNTRSLARKYNKKCYVLESNILDFISFNENKNSKDSIESNAKNTQDSIESIDNFASNFELKARQIRYNFFFNLLDSKNYKNLITAHQLDDKIEWFFMRFLSGSGINSLLGFESVESRFYGGKEFKIIRPLINVSKSEILEYNKINNIEYFIDKSNENTKFFRNYVRAKITKNIESRFYKNIKKSFEYLQKEKEILYPKVMICVDFNLFYCKNSNFKSALHRIYIIDKLSKRLGYVLSSKQKNEIDELFFNLDFGREPYKECVMGEKIIIAINEQFLFVGFKLCNKDSKKVIESRIPKKFREIYRKQKIPPKIREIMYYSEITFL